MTNKETATHLRKYMTEGPHDRLEWPTDACGYDQHILFVNHRNTHWEAYAAASPTTPVQDLWLKFVLEYADSLETKPEPNHEQIVQDLSHQLDGHRQEGILESAQELIPNHLPGDGELK